MGRRRRVSCAISPASSKTCGECCFKSPTPGPSRKDAERTFMAGEIRLPDIGDFKDVPIIEIHMKPGQTVAKEEVLLTLESDKATLDVPAPEAGVIGEIKVKVGDKVSEGSLLATFAGAAAASAPAKTAAPQAAKGPAEPKAA